MANEFSNSPTNVRISQDGFGNNQTNNFQMPGTQPKNFKQYEAAETIKKAIEVYAALFHSSQKPVIGLETSAIHCFYSERENLVTIIKKNASNLCENAQNECIKLTHKIMKLEVTKPSEIPGPEFFNPLANSLKPHLDITLAEE